MYRALICAAACAAVILFSGVSSAEDPGSVEGFINGDIWHYDVNGDGFVTVDDAQYILDQLAIGPPYPWWIDVNQDGTVEPLDALLILNALAKRPWQNNTLDWTDQFDVNNSNDPAKVTPLDALLVLNRISDLGGNPPYSFRQADADKANYYDVNGDNVLTLDDAQAVLSYLSSL